MKNEKQQLIIDQTERKLETFRVLNQTENPQRGWVYTIRTALKMSLRQLGNKLSVSPQSVKEMEEREVSGSITLKSLNELARVLDMKLVYGFVSKHESLEKMIEKRAIEIAQEIVMRTNTTMILEDQQISSEKIKQAIDRKAFEIKNEMPKYLWD